MKNHTQKSTMAKIYTEKQNANVAIIVPTYNVEHYLLETLQSIENQTYKRYIVVIVDDGSTDGTIKLLDKWCKGKSNYFYFKEKHNGVSKARNKALDLVASMTNIEYILFLDSDDILSEQCLERAVQNCVNNSADICAFGQKAFHKDTIINKSEKEKTHTLQNKNEIIRFFLDFRKEDYPDFTNTHSNFLCNRLYSKSLIAKTRFDEQMQLGEDQAFTLPLFLKASKVILDSHIGYLYRLRKSSASQTLKNKDTISPLYFVNKKFYNIESKNNHKNKILDIIAGTTTQWLWHSALLMLSKDSIHNHTEWKKLKNEATKFSDSARNNLNFKNKRRLFLIQHPLLLSLFYKQKAIRKVANKSPNNLHNLFE